MAVDTLVTGSKLTAIADAIRTVCDTDSTYTLDEMPNAILKGGGGGGSSFDWSKVMSLQGMFQGSDITSFDVSSMQGVNAVVTSMMFGNCTSLQSITGLGAINMHNSSGSSIDAQNMFRGVPATTLDFTGAVWTNRIYNTAILAALFSDMSNLQQITLPRIVLGENRRYGNVTINGMFRDCTSLEYIDFETIDASAASTSSGCDIGNMCAGCSSLEYVNMPSVYSMNGMSNYSPVFNNCTSLQYIFVPTTPNGHVPSLSSGYLFNSTDGGNPNNVKIVVPDDQVDAFKAATNWSLFADYIVGKSEYFG